MPETLEAPVQQTQVAQETIAPAFNPFKSDSWVTENAPASQTVSIVPPATETVTPPANEQAATSEPVTPQPAPETNADQILDENDFVKTKFGFESVEEVKRVIEELKAHKEKQIEFKNDESKKAYEYLIEGKEDDLYEVLDKKRKINKLLSAENIDENVAPELIKLGMKLKHSSLSDQEIDFLYKSKYTIPAKPVQSDLETEDEYAAKVADWESKSQAVKMQMTIDAKLSKPDLEKFKTELILPDIKRNEPVNNEPSAEVLEAAQKARDKFLGSLKSEFSKFNGYETKVKDGSIEIPVSFVVPEEERVALRSKIEGIEDIVQYFNQRWFDANDNLNAQKIMSDLYYLENSEKVFQGIANNAASQRLVEYIKQSSNIKLDNGLSDKTSTETITEGPMSIDQQVAALWKQKY